MPALAPSPSPGQDPDPDRDTDHPHPLALEDGGAAGLHTGSRQTRKRTWMPPRHVAAWYCYAFAAEVYNAAALAIFLPITLEKIARDVGYAGPDWLRRCGAPIPPVTASGGGGGGLSSGLADGVPVPDLPGGKEVCRVSIGGLWVDTVSFSMYVKSLAVALQALCIITVGPLADNPSWRRNLLALFALLGGASGMLFLALPTASSLVGDGAGQDGSPNTRDKHDAAAGAGWAPLGAALLTILGNIGYAVGQVCSNAFLPGLAREDERVRAALRDEPAETSDGDTSAEEETPSGEVHGHGEGAPLLPPVLESLVERVSPADLALNDADSHNAALVPDSSESHGLGSADVDADADTAAHRLLSLTTSRLSSTGTALGLFSGVAILALLMVPITLLGGSTASLCLAIALSGAWWVVFLLPAYLSLPRGAQGRTRTRSETEAGSGRVGAKYDDAGRWSVFGLIRLGWRRTAGMVRLREMRRLKNLFVFLLSWIFLCDGFHTTTYTAILYASSHIGMSPPRIVLMGILTQISAVVSALLAPRLQRARGWTNAQVLVRTAVAGGVLPVYACVGLVLPVGGLRSEGEMYAAAVWFGALYGPFNSYSRAVYAELIPTGHESSFFSLFALTDKSASFIGPFAVGLIADLTGNIRLGFVFLLVMLAVPVPILLRVDVEEGRREAREWAKRRERTE